jgi:glucokinase
MLLAADVGGTKARMGLFRRESPRPLPVVVREYPTRKFGALDDLVRAFLDEAGHGTIEAFCAGVAGPIRGSTARLVNAPWVADLDATRARVGDCPARLLNDLEAMASAIPVLRADELAVLQPGNAAPDGNAALIAAGTGLGQALLHRVDGRFVAAASEGGHADYAARTSREIALLETLRTHGRVDVERVVSGRGLAAIARMTHGSGRVAAACPAIADDIGDADLPAAITESALTRRCQPCIEALDTFVEAYGAEAGNLALRAVATAGLYVGGGIAPKILSALEAGAFIRAFCDKAPMEDLLRAVPVSVILNADAGLLGAAVRAAELVDRR